MGFENPMDSIYEPDSGIVDVIADLGWLTDGPIMDAKLLACIRLGERA